MVIAGVGSTGALWQYCHSVESADGPEWQWQYCHNAPTRSPACCNSLVQRQRHARRRSIRHTVLVVANLPRNLEAEEVIVSLTAFHEELTVTLVQHEGLDRRII